MFWWFHAGRKQMTFREHGHSQRVSSKHSKPLPVLHSPSRSLIGTYDSGAYHPAIGYFYRDRAGREIGGTGSVTRTGDVVFYFDTDLSDVYDGPLTDEFGQTLDENAVFALSS